MADKIKLPLLPEPVNYSDVQIPGDDAFNQANAVWGYTEDQLRARDLEVARVVLEAAARVCDTTPPYPFRPSIEAAHAIRALEFTHD